jgi:hypothetical protein
LPLSALELEGYLGRCTVVDAERLIEHSSRPIYSLVNDTTIKGKTTQHETSLVLPSGEGVHSVEIPLGHPLYRRWIHTCNRCQRHWVAEKGSPKKCVHCKSPYWNLPRERHVGGGRLRHGNSDQAYTRRQP